MDERTKTWIENVRKNAPHVHNDMRDLFDVWKMPTVTILAAGASLLKLTDEITKIRKSSLIVTSPTVVPWFNHVTGEWPDLVINVDPHPWLATLVGSSPSLALTPQVSHEWIGTYGMKHWFLSLDQGDDGQINSSEFSRMTKTLFSNIRTHTAQMGCVTNEAIWLMYQMLPLIGAKAIILAGADYSYWRGLARVPVAEPFEPKSIVESDMHSPVMWDGHATNMAMVNYLAQIAIVQQAHNMPIYTMSDGITNSIFQRVTPRQVISARLPKPWSKAKTETRCAAVRADFDKRIS